MSIHRETSVLVAPSCGLWLQYSQSTANRGETVGPTHLLLTLEMKQHNSSLQTKTLPAPHYITPSHPLPNQTIGDGCPSGCWSGMSGSETPWHMPAEAHTKHINLTKVARHKK